MPEAGEAFVFVVNDGRVERRKVTLGKRAVGLVEVREGLDASEEVVVKGFATLRDGDRVRNAGEAKGA
jgi:HlyD family secretion protein